MTIPDDDTTRMLEEEVDDHNRPIAVVSMRDLIDYLSNFFSREILNLPPDPIVGFRNRDGA